MRSSETRHGSVNLIPAHRRVRQEERYKLAASLDYIVSSISAWTTQQGVFKKIIIRKTKLKRAY